MMSNKSHCNNKNPDNSKILAHDSPRNPNSTAYLDRLKDRNKNTNDSVPDAYEDNECQALLEDNDNDSLNITSRLRSVSCNNSAECREKK